MAYPVAVNLQGRRLGLLPAVDVSGLPHAGDMPHGEVKREVADGS
jgi:hypothetical protein